MSAGYPRSPVTSPSTERRQQPQVAFKSSGKDTGRGKPSEATTSSSSTTTTTMASDDCCKDDSLDYAGENRTDSGIDSYRSILKSEEAPREPDMSGPREKFSTVEERLDSAYGSSSITGESLTELVESCTLSSSAQEEQTYCSELSEQEENLLTTITEEGDT